MYITSGNAWREGTEVSHDTDTHRWALLMHEHWWSCFLMKQVSQKESCYVKYWVFTYRLCWVPCMLGSPLKYVKSSFGVQHQYGAPFHRLNLLYFLKDLGYEHSSSPLGMRRRLTLCRYHFSLLHVSTFENLTWYSPIFIKKQHYN